MYKYFFIFFVYLTSCLPFQNLVKSEGEVYGWLSLNPKPKKISMMKAFSKVTITIKPYGKKITPDSNGIFYTDKIPVGTYSIEATSPNYRSTIIEDVEILKDSISIVYFNNGISKTYDYNNEHPVREEWKKVRIKSVNINSPGKICGTVKDIDSSEILSKFTNVIVRDTFWGTSVDSTGYYCIENILPGEYTLSASSLGYHRSIYTKVKVLTNMTSIVNFQLHTAAIPEEPFPLIWKASYKPMFEKK